MKNVELVFIPFPARGHVAPTIETAKLLAQLDNGVSTTVLLMSPTHDSSTIKYTETLLAESTLPNNMRVVQLPSLEPPSQQCDLLNYLIEGQKPHVKEFVDSKIMSTQSSDSSPRFAGFVFDAFCTGMKDLADEFGVPWYVFSSSGAAFIGCLLHMHALHDKQKVDITEFKNSDVNLEILGLMNPIPARFLPPFLFKKETVIILEAARRLRESRGILINTILELEFYAVNSISKICSQPLYPAGSVVKGRGESHHVGSDQSKAIMEWLDDQPPSSVVFLCFGSLGNFSANQIQEIANALECRGDRFVWALHKPLPIGKMESPPELEEMLLEGFLDRTAEIGKIIGWAPQRDILAHQSIGGFVSHCGWNSILESIYNGVPIAAWPLYAEQQFNAFQVVTDLGLAVEIKQNHKKDSKDIDNEEIVSSKEIEKGIKSVMEQDGEIRKNVKKMSQICKKALMDGGSSYISLGSLIEDVRGNLA